MAAKRIDQPFVFAMLGAGGVLLVHSITGSSLADVLKGKAGKVSASGIDLSSVAGVGSTVTAGSTTAVGGAVGTGALPAGASSRLNANQLAFAQELQKQTGLDGGVIAAWVLAEEGGQSQAPNGPNNWLNIGATDSGFYGGGNPAWQNPISAADETAAWLKGSSAAGFGSASPGIRAVLGTAGQSPQTQIAALQHSGWASSGYPDLPELYAEVAG
jgi:hypothetical protein